MNYTAMRLRAMLHKADEAFKPLLAYSLAPTEEREPHLLEVVEAIRAQGALLTEITQAVARLVPSSRFVP